MNTNHLSGKLALVTGAGRGIGKGCALALARAGAELVVNDRPGSPDIAATADEIRALGCGCVIIEADAFTRRGCEELVARAIREAGRIDVLISNPAFNVRRAFLDFDAEDFERVLDATLHGGFHLGQLVARHMVERGNGGKVVFISSVHVPVPYAGSVAYNAAKAGLNNMARTMAMELTGHRINVNIIEPGWIDTPGERESFGDELIERSGRALPWGRMGLPVDIGKAAAFLASDDADYITAAVLRIDGGLAFKECLSEE